MEALRACCPGGAHYARQQAMPIAQVVTPIAQVATTAVAMPAAIIGADIEEPTGSVIRPYVPPVDGFVAPVRIAWNAGEEAVVDNQGTQGTGKKRRGRPAGSRNKRKKVQERFN